MMTSANDVVLTKRITLTQSQGDGDEKEALLITLNRPSKNNCFNTRVCHELATIFHDVANEIERHDAVVRPTDDGSSDDDGRRQRRMRQKNELVAVIFTGAGKSFCAGADLSNPPNPLHQSSDLPHHLRWNPVHQMGRVGVPIIGALSGHVSYVINYATSISGRDIVLGIFHN
jgi:enoyl-CoA hydratase/carnithine racemase